MALRWDARAALDGKMTEYLEYVDGLYKKKKSVVVGMNGIRCRYKHSRGMGTAIIERMEELGLAEIFTEGERNNAYRLDLRKIRRYLKDAKGNE
jgi:hypothetical protein